MLKLLLITLLTISVFGVEIVIDKTVKKLDITVENKSKFTRDDVKEVVFDSATSLMWQDDSHAKSVKKDWSDAKSYCQNLTHAGYDDWYLPSIKEIETLADTTRYNPAIKKEFKNTVSSNYWSSSPYVSNSKHVWGVDFKYGHSYNRSKTFELCVRCARAGQ